MGVFVVLTALRWVEGELPGLVISSSRHPAPASRPLPLSSCGQVRSYTGNP